MAVAKTEFYVDLAGVEQYQKSCMTYLDNISTAMKSIQKQFNALATNKGVLGNFETLMLNNAKAAGRRASLAQKRKIGLEKKLNADISYQTRLFLASYQAQKAVENVENVPTGNNN